MKKENTLQIKRANENPVLKSTSVTENWMNDKLQNSEYQG